MGKVNLTGNPNHLPIKKQPEELNTLEARSNPELAKWYHATLFSPVKKNLIQATRSGQFTTWAYLTVDFIYHLPPSMDTEKLHMNKIRKNIQSVKTQDKPPTEDEPM